MLNTYTWYLNDAVDGKIHLDYREKRGVGAGPDLNLHLGQWGEADFKYYYLHDQDPNNGTGTNSFANLGAIPENRQRFYLDYQATPFTNLNLKALVNYQSDPLVLHDFFEGDYTAITRSPTHSSRSTSIGTTGVSTPKPRRASMISSTRSNVCPM